MDAPSFQDGRGSDGAESGGVASLVGLHAREVVTASGPRILSAVGIPIPRVE